MKLIVKISKYLFAFAVLSAFVLTGCIKADTDLDYGFPLIYMPQATVTQINNYYTIPRGPIEEYSTYNCYYENGKLNIVLGVSRAGKIANTKGFSVTLSVAQAETASAVAAMNEAGGVEAMVLPNVYTLPSSITVEAGKNSGAVYMSVDMNALAQIDDIVVDNQWKRLVLAVEISNPTEYELSDTNTSVVIIIDLNSSFWNWGTPPNLVFTK